MTDSNHPENLDFVFELYSELQHDELNYIYRGYFDNRITEGILMLAEANIVKDDENSIIGRRVYHIMVESLQNITRHQSAISKAEDAEAEGVFVIQKKDSHYYVTTGNPVELQAIEPLRGKLQTINQLNDEELKRFYKSKLQDGRISDKGGAGLGLIEMARKSGNKLLYDFKLIDDLHSYFYLSTKIPSKNASASESDYSVSIDYINSLHRIINDRKILVVFTSYFNQDSMLSLMSILERHGKTVALRKALNSMLVEILQNISKHGADYKSTSQGKPGLFFISETDESYMLNSGNYIKKSQVENLRNQINSVNSLSLDELNDHYDSQLLNFDNVTSETTGLGFIDIKLKSGHDIFYHIQPVNEQYSFITLQTTVSKNL